MELRTIPIRKSGVRPQLFIGGDRELVMFTGLISVILIVAAQDWLALIYGICLWTISIKVLRIMAKADPLMRQVYLRQRLYKSYYSPRATPFRVNSHAQEGRYK